MRVGGRLKNALLSYDVTHPIILPKENNITQLIIKDAHLTTKHGGPQLTLAQTRQRFWIMDGRNQVKRFVHRCVICFKNAPKISKQLMGELPYARVTPTHPFMHSGIDFAGPIQIRLSKGRGMRSYKGYIAVIVYFVTKAIHLELVTDLTASALLAALKRFMARRGICSDIYSDNATNFIRVAKDIRKDLMVAIREATREAADTLANDGVTWHYIPPSSPHFGGLWEAGVRSTKHHLQRILGSHTLTYEEMSTVLYQIESVLNSRPLSPMSSNPEDLQALTPSHFLIGRPLTTLPEPNLLDCKTSLLSRWKTLQQMYQMFWKQWRQDYLNQLHQRTKWRTPQANLYVGQLVIVKDERLPPSKWLMGRLVEVHPGADGLVRTATIKCKDSISKRPVAKLCLLPIPDNEN